MNGSDAVRQWLSHVPVEIPQRHMILLNDRIYDTYDDYQDALYDYNMLKENPKDKIYLLKNFWISGYNINDQQSFNDIETALTLRYDKWED